MFRFLFTLAIIGSALSFTPPTRNTRVNIALDAKSQSVPFLENPAALTGKITESYCAICSLIPL